MVIVLQGQRKANKWGSVGRGLAEGLNSALEARERRQDEERQFARENKSRTLKNLEAQEQFYLQRKQLEEGLSVAEQLFSNPNLSPEQKQIGLFKALRSNPDLAKTLGSQLSSLGPKQMSPYEQAQLDQLNEEKSFFDQMFGNGEAQPTSNMAPENDFDEMGNEPSQGATRRSQKQQFNYRDPATWSDKQIDQFKSIDGKTAKAKTLSNMAKNEFERRQESKKAKTKYQESIAPLQSAVETIGRMEQLGKKGNLGIGTKVRGVLSSQARRDASEYERLGKSLIQYSSNIPIRNRQEFETLAHDLYDPSISDASREGILNAMKRIIQNSMMQYELPKDEDENLPSSRTAAPSQKEKRPLTDFMKG